MDSPDTSRGIVVRGAREHNLKNLSLTLPRRRLVVITGVSGSGKSSLAFDTLYAEGQRRYVESLSAYARQFLGQMEKPDVDSIEGLSPAISIEQKGAGSNPRSTVATLTEIYDYLRLLFARLGTPHCPEDGTPLSRQSVAEMVDTLSAQAGGAKVLVLAPIVRGRKGEYRQELEDARKKGYLRARIDGALVELDEGTKLAKTRRHTIEIVVDRLTVEAKNARRLADSLEAALGLAGGVAAVAKEGGADWLFSQSAACVQCGRSYEELAPRLFSFNSPYGACPACDGLGTSLEIDPKLLLPDPSRSIADGAIGAGSTAPGTAASCARSSSTSSSTRRRPGRSCPGGSRTRSSSAPETPSCTTSTAPRRAAAGSTRASSRACWRTSSAVTRTPRPRRCGARSRAT